MLLAPPVRPSGSILRRPSQRMWSEYITAENGLLGAEKGHEYHPNHPLPRRKYAMTNVRLQTENVIDPETDDEASTILFQRMAKIYRDAALATLLTAFANFPKTRAVLEHMWDEEDEGSSQC